MTINTATKHLFPWSSLKFLKSAHLIPHATPGASVATLLISRMKPRLGLSQGNSCTCASNPGLRILFIPPIQRSPVGCYILRSITDVPVIYSAFPLVSSYVTPSVSPQHLITIHVFLAQFQILCTSKWPFS